MHPNLGEKWPVSELFEPARNQGAANKAFGTDAKVCYPGLWPIRIVPAHFLGFWRAVAET